MLSIPSWVHDYTPGDGPAPILDWCHSADIAVHYTRALASTRLGAYDHHQRVIWLPVNLDVYTPLGVATLAHESVHAYREDDGPQPGYVEARINEMIAAALIERDEYQCAEKQVGACTGGIVDLLNQPRWLVATYRRHLARTRREHAHAAS